MTATAEKTEWVSIKRRQTACVDLESSRYDLDHAIAVPASDGGAWIVSSDARCAAASRAEADIRQIHAIDPRILGRKKRAQKLAITGDSTTLNGEPVARASYERFPPIDTAIRSAADDMQDRRRVKIDVKLLANVAAAVSDEDEDGIVELWLPEDRHQPIVVSGNAGVGILMGMDSASDYNDRVFRERVGYVRAELAKAAGDIDSARTV